MKRKLGLVLLTATMLASMAGVTGCSASASVKAGGEPAKTAPPPPPPPPKKEEPPPPPPKKEEPPPPPPVKEKPKIVQEGSKINIPGNIVFKTGSAELDPVSFPVLDSAVEYLKENPTVTLFRVEGHTDSDGARDMNRTLSANRAMAVKAYLVSKGIDKARLLAVGFGPDRPLVDNNTPENKAQNRRVEFHIAEVSGKKFAGKEKDGSTATIKPVVPSPQ